VAGALRGRGCGGRMGEMSANSTSDFMRLVRFSIALSFAGLAGFMSSIRQVNPHARFEFDWIVVLALVFGWFFGAWFTKAFLPQDEKAVSEEDDKVRRGRLAKLGFFGLLPSGAILMGLVFLVGDASSKKQYDYFLGFAGAVIFLTVLGWLLHRVVSFFEGMSDAEAPEEKKDGGERN
jgi:FtsH-binding integral membrane protein